MDTDHSLADSVSFLQIQSYSAHPEVITMANSIVDAFCKGKQRSHRQKYISPARKLIASLWLHKSDLFRFSTSEDHYGKYRKQVWMSHTVLALFRHMLQMDPPLVRLALKAIPPALSKDGVGRSTIYARTPQFREQLKSLQVTDIQYDKDLPRITLENTIGGKDIFLEISDEEKAKPWYIFSKETLIKHSEFLSKANIKLANGTSLSADDYTYIRRFKNSTEQTGRLYSRFTNRTKEDRLGITFSGLPAMSLDFSSLHPHLLLRLVYGMDKYTVGLLTTDTREFYEVPEFEHLPRAVHKQLFNTLLNATTEESATRALNSAYFLWDSEKNKFKVRIYKGSAKREGHKAFPGKSKEILTYINNLKLHHPAFAPLLGKGLGNILQKIDSDIMLMVLRLATEREVPVLPIHDELVFPASMLEKIKHVLVESWHTALNDFGRFGVISLKLCQADDTESWITLTLISET